MVGADLRNCTDERHGLQPSNTKNWSPLLVQTRPKNGMNNSGRHDPIILGRTRIVLWKKGPSLQRIKNVVQKNKTSTMLLHNTIQIHNNVPTLELYVGNSQEYSMEYYQSHKTLL